METITEYMMQDHVLIDGIFERAGSAAAAQDFAALEREAELFLQRIGRHIDIEETLLFPAFEERTGMSAGGPSAQMRVEHQQMDEVFGRMREALGKRDAGAYQRAAQALLEILVPHNLKEEQMMYPMIEQAVGDEASSLLAEVRRMAVAA